MTGVSQAVSKTQPAGSTGKNVKDILPKKQGRRPKDECVPVHCKKCDKYLATVIPKAEVLCLDCSTEARPVWTEAAPRPAKASSVKRNQRRKTSK
jgi:hypothetical protein